MLIPLINITITQVTPYINSSNVSVPRSKTFTFSVCHSVEINSTWKNLTDTGTIILPKNIYVTDENDNDISLGAVSNQANRNNLVASQQYVSGFPQSNIGAPPLFMRGDKISISAGYKYPSFENANGTYTYNTTINQIFSGYISAVDARIPIKLSLEDNMWKCKQVAAVNKNYPAGEDNMGQILADFTTQTGFQVLRAPDTSAFGTLNIGNFRIKNETWAKVFERLRKEKRLYFYFRGNILRGGGIVYYPQDQGTSIPFVFQKNIIKDSLVYKLESDINIGAICYSTNSVKQAKMNATGNTRQSTSRLETTVGSDKEAANEYFTFFFVNVTSIAQLQALGKTQLAKYYYTGFHGKFLTFGLPMVIHGNIVNLSDTILPERNGNYLVKGVKTTWGVTEGFRQELELHFRTDNLTSTDLANGL